MRNGPYGPSLYFATDKNVFDALNQHKVDPTTVMKLFQRRNIIVDMKSSREDLARYFARLSHDYYDHKDIAARLGITPRRERITSMDVLGVGTIDVLLTEIDRLKQELENTGDVMQISLDGDNLTLHVQYSTVDYKLNEFSQVQVRDGVIEFIKSPEGYIVRNTQNDYVNDIRDTLLGKIDDTVGAPFTKVVVSLFDVPSSKLRSKFFHELVVNLPGYTWDDVTNVYVYKAKPDDDTDDTAFSDSDTHVERVVMRGNGLTRSQLLNELIEDDDYYITKIGWTTKQNLGAGDIYDIEAVFSDPKNCTGFSFILSGVFPLENGKISSRRRTPSKNEINSISHVIESKSRELVKSLRDEFAVSNGGS